MAKRISVDAKIVLENAGYVVEYVYGKRNKVTDLRVYSSDFLQDHPILLPVVGACIENSLIEDLLEKAK